MISTTHTQSVKWLSLALVLFLLGACGGSSDDPQTPSIDPILVNAGEDITLNEGETAAITGGSSGGSGAITYAWTSANDIEITQEDPSLPDAVLTAPVVTQTTTYNIILSATDESAAQQSDSFTLTVNPINEVPSAIISTNQIDGYASQTYPVTSLITLDGSTSTDSDPQDAQSPITNYLWQQIAGPSMLAGIDSSQSSIELVAPILDVGQIATFRLTVTDQEQATNSTDINLTLLAQNSTIPSVSVNSIRNVFAGEIVSLSGSADSIAPDAAPFNATWSNTIGAQIDDVGSFSTHALAPLVNTTTDVTYTLIAEDSFGNSVSAQTNAQVYAATTRFVNDTGVTTFANEESVFTAYQQDFAGQDADFGADRQNVSGQVIKVGDGEAGFDFTRLDSNGDAVDNPSFAFSCVRDNVTGLIWQIKDNVDTTSIEYVDQSFTWFSDEENGNFEGELNAGSTSCNVSNGQCNTQDYVSEVNATGMCGFFDWRVPSASELHSIIHYGKTTAPLVDTVFFPYWGDSDSQPLWYWTNQPSADGLNNDVARNAWAFDMNTGNDGFLAKSSQQRVMLVRAGR